jgi:membrane protease YdiL (CAAX protease family)
MVLLPVGSIAGALTGIAVLGPVFAVALPLCAATVFLRQEGNSWSDLGLARRLPLVHFSAWVLGTLALTWFVTTWVITPALFKLGAPPVNIAPLEQLIEGDLTQYLLFLIPVAWGSAAIGEEMLTRGFLLHRISTLSNVPTAVVLQAAFFALAHFYQGITGMVNIFFLALIFGTVYLKCGKSLLPTIVAHGLIDTISVTLLYYGRGDLLTGAG